MKSYTICKLLTISLLLLSGSYANAAGSLQEAFSQGTVNGEVRTYFFSRDFEKNIKKDREDFAVGTSLYYHTAPLSGLSAGIAFASANDIASDRDKATYGLLAADHENVARLQEYYIQGDWFKTNIKYGAHEIETPFMNTHDIRLIPRTYKGLSVVNNSIDNLTLSAHYITGHMGWTDSEFLNVAEVDGVTTDDDKGVIIAGAEYKLPVDSVNSTAQAWYYNMADVFTDTYFKVSLDAKAGDYKFKLAPSYLIQRSAGDELAGDIDTEQYGLSAGVGAYGATLTGYYAKTGDSGIFAPWGDEKIVIMQLYHSERAEEDAYAVKLNYDFGAIGIKGLSTYVFYGVFDTPDSGGNASSDASETDLSATYAFHGILDGFSVRARYAMVNVKDGEDINDFRFYLRFKFGIKGS